MIQVTTTQFSGPRWLELTLSRVDDGADRPMVFPPAFAGRLELADESAADSGPPDWESAILRGAAAGFKKLHVKPAAVHVHTLRGRLAADDAPALAHSAKVAIMSLFGHAEVGLSIPGWSVQAIAVPPGGRADPSHVLPAPHAANLGEPVPGTLLVTRLGKFEFKKADTPDEFEQVHRLNYKTFVREIQQHADTGEGRLVDKFHEWNTYFLAKLGDRVVGMISVHDRPPFSVESRLPDRSVIEQPGMRPLEVRLLAIDQEERKGAVLLGMTAVMNCYARERGYTHYVISAVTGQIELYRHLGFEVIGPAVGKPGAMFAPMMATLAQVTAHMQRSLVLWERRAAREVRT